MNVEVGRGVARGAERQSQRAWAVLAAASAAAIVIALLLVIGGRWVYAHATRPMEASVQIVSGSGALWRPNENAEWTLITGERTISEGDQVSTALGTVLWITLFDGSTVEVTEDSVVTFDRMRAARFTDTTKHYVIEVERGLVYAALAPHGKYEYSEMTLRGSGVDLTTSDEPGRANAGAMLFEVIESVDDTDQVSIRTAVLRGGATVSSEEAHEQLSADEQVIVARPGVIGERTAAVRQFVRNGRFESGLDGWTEFHDSAGVNVATRSGEVALAGSEIEGAPVQVVELRREPPSEPMAQAGIRQTIGKTLRVYAGLQLSFDVRIDMQNPAGAGPENRDFPLTVVLQYVDTQGEERLWSRGYYVVEDPERQVPHALATRLLPATWEHIVFDLRNLQPLPRQITSIVLYASGNGYLTQLANVSLTASELSEPGP